MNYTGRTCRFEKRCTPVNLKQGLNCFTQHHPTLTLAEIAARVEYPVDRLRKAANESQRGQIPAPVLLRLVKEFDAPWLMHLALMDAGLDADFSFARRRPVAAADDPQRASLDMVIASSKAAESVRDALVGDGVIDLEEYHRSKTAIRKTREGVDQLDRAVDACASQTVRDIRAVGR